MAISKLHIRTLAYLSLFLLYTEAQPPPCSSYQFEFQPVVELPCNPYSDPANVILKCSIKGPVLPNNTYATISWFRRLDSDVVGTEELSETSDSIEIATGNALISEEVMVTSILRVAVLDSDPANITGLYWCVMKAGMETPRGNREYESLKSDITELQAAVAYQDSDPCQDMALATDSNACVAFEALPDFLAPPSVQSTDVTSELAMDFPEEPFLDTTMIIVLSSIGVLLCVVIHVLLAIVSCLCVKSRKKKRVRGISQSRKVSTVSLISSPPLRSSNSPPLPPHPMTLPLSSQPTHLLSNTRAYLLSSPPTRLPPVPNKKPPMLPQGRNRSSLPSRLSHTVTLMDSSDDDVYAPVQIKNRAATIAADMITTCVEHYPDPFGEEDQCKYKSLNRDMMNGQQVYEDPAVSASDYNIDNDENDDGDSDLDSIYVATILKNTDPGDSLLHPSATSDPNTLSPNIPSSLSIHDTKPASQRVQSPMLLSPQSSTLVPLVRIARASMDGEYVLPNEAFDGGLLSPTEEDEDNEISSDYIDIS